MKEIEVTCWTDEDFDNTKFRERLIAFLRENGFAVDGGEDTFEMRSSPRRGTVTYACCKVK